MTDYEKMIPGCFVTDIFHIFVIYFCASGIIYFLTLVISIVFLVVLHLVIFFIELFDFQILIYTKILF